MQRIAGHFLGVAWNEQPNSVAHPIIASDVSETGGDQIIRASASANIDPGRGGTYQITIAIERVQKS
jgi:hypothetical protein